jgi:hypothetical protein
MRASSSRASWSQVARPLEQARDALRGRIAAVPEEDVQGGDQTRIIVFA